MKSLPQEPLSFPDIREQALDELRRLTPYILPTSWIDALICNPLERRRPLSPYERHLLLDLASLMNSEARHDPNKLIDALQSCWHTLPEDRARLESLRASLVRSYSVVEQDAGKYRPTEETVAGMAASAEHLFASSDTFRQRLEQFTIAHLRPHGLELMAVEVTQFEGRLFAEGVGAIFEHLSALSQKEGYPLDEENYGYVQAGPIFRDLARSVFNSIAETLPGDLRSAGDWIKRRALMELSLMVAERKLTRLSPSCTIAPKDQRRVVGFASFGLAQIRADCRAANADSVARVFRQNLAEYRCCVRVLNCFASAGEILRHLIQLLRVMRVPVVERDLSYWGAPAIRKSPCDLIVLDLVQSIHQHVTELGDEGAAVHAAREEFGEFCLSRLQTDKSAKGDPRKNGSPIMVERSPIWRVAYLRALQAMRCNPQGKGHRMLHWLERNDPDERVRNTAAEIYPFLRGERGSIPDSSPKRPFITAIWWLLRAHLMDQGVDPDTDRAVVTREAFMRRTSERYPQSPSRAPIVVGGPSHPPFAAV